MSIALFVCLCILNAKQLLSAYALLDNCDYVHMLQCSLFLK